MPTTRPRADHVDKYVANRLREKRQRRGLTQTDLGTMLGVSFQQIQKYEMGTNRIAASRLYHLARLLEVDIESFFPPDPIAAPRQYERQAR